MGERLPSEGRDPPSFSFQGFTCNPLFLLARAPFSTYFLLSSGDASETSRSKKSSVSVVSCGYL